MADVSSSPPQPDYVALTRFLLEPLLESPHSLKLDCEILAEGTRCLIRIAFEGEEQGRALGRGGRNIRAVRSILQAAGHLAHQTIQIEVFGGHALEAEAESGSEFSGSRSSAPRSRRSPSRHPRRHR